MHSVQKQVTTIQIYSLDWLHNNKFFFSLEVVKNTAKSTTGHNSVPFSYNRRIAQKNWDVEKFLSVESFNERQVKNRAWNSTSVPRILRYNASHTSNVLFNICPREFGLLYAI